MGQSIAGSPDRRHPVLPDIGRPHMAKASVREPDTTLMELLGAAIQRAILEVWETNKLAAADLQVDDAEFGKWMNGTRRPQFDKLFAVEALREPLIVAMADMIAGAKVTRRIDFADRRPWSGAERRRA